MNDIKTTSIEAFSPLCPCFSPEIEVWLESWPGKLKKKMYCAIRGASVDMEI